MAHGRRTPPEKIEEIKALSVAFDAKTISRKTGVPLRTVYDILQREDSPVIEAERAKRAERIRGEVWDKARETIEQEISTLKDKCDMLLEHLTPEKAAKARATELTTAYGILFDKKRLLEDKSTANVAQQLVFHVVHEDGREVPVSSADHARKKAEAIEDGDGNAPERKE